MGLLKKISASFFGRSSRDVEQRVSREQAARKARARQRNMMLERERLLIETLEAAAPGEAMEAAQRILERRRLSEDDEERELSWLEFHTALAETVKESSRRDKENMTDRQDRLDERGRHNRSDQQSIREGQAQLDRDGAREERKRGVG